MQLSVQVVLMYLYLRTQTFNEHDHELRCRILSLLAIEMSSTAGAFFMCHFCLSPALVVPRHMQHPMLLISTCMLVFRLPSDNCRFTKHAYTYMRDP